MVHVRRELLFYGPPNKALAFERSGDRTAKVFVEGKTKLAVALRRCEWDKILFVQSRGKNECYPSLSRYGATARLAAGIACTGKWQIDKQAGATGKRLRTPRLVKLGDDRQHKVSFVLRRCVSFYQPGSNSDLDLFITANRKLVSIGILGLNALPDLDRFGRRKRGLQRTCSIRGLPYSLATGKTHRDQDQKERNPHKRHIRSINLSDNALSFR